ncbi:Aste57867_8111 [Aphanomyces stellatus]|uniref:Aste57867_8111 protein n=1 Tax=Aphanomyces stellatus TaxID=120398 RepID=A0A485KJG1_9STRA|nr:hypothetical protein As57867_008081 [Aphanomyces stellatus]VFT85000.1 Aste57867_8111 [Aphanomyces stellatus]
MGDTQSKPVAGCVNETNKAGVLQDQYCFDVDHVLSIDVYADGAAVKLDPRLQGANITKVVVYVVAAHSCDPHRDMSSRAHGFRWGMKPSLELVGMSSIVLDNVTSLDAIDSWKLASVAHLIIMNSPLLDTLTLTSWKQLASLNLVNNTRLTQINLPPSHPDSTAFTPIQVNLENNPKLNTSALTLPAVILTTETSGKNTQPPVLHNFDSPHVSTTSPPPSSNTNTPATSMVPASPTSSLSPTSTTSLPSSIPSSNVPASSSTGTTSVPSATVPTTSKPPVSNFTESAILDANNATSAPNLATTTLLPVTAAPSLDASSSSSFNGLLIGVAVAAAVVGLVVVAILLYRRYTHRRHCRRSTAAPATTTTTTTLAASNADLFAALPADQQLSMDTTAADMKKTRYLFKTTFEGQPVVVKYTPTANAAPFIAMFQDLLTLHHPNLVSLLGFVAVSRENLTDETCVGVVAEFVELGPLSSRLYMPKIDMDDALKWDMCMDVAVVVQYLHGLGRAVGDGLTSRGVLVTDEQRIKLNLFRFWHDSPVCDGISIGAGRSLHRAPEVHAGRTLNAQAADIYALGVLLAEICTRTLPFQHETHEMGPVALDVFLHDQTCKPDLIHPYTSDQLTGWPADLQMLLVRCWHADPTARPHIDEVVECLQRLLNERFTC